MLQFALAPDAPSIRIDRNGLEESLLGLIANASRATVEGGLVEISTGLIALPDGKPGVRLEVRDNGQPVPASDRLYVFDPYQHSGLALSVIYRFVMLSGGQIDVASSPGEGTSYRLDFPAVESASRAASSRYRVATAV